MRKSIFFILAAFVAALLCGCAGYTVYPVKSKPMMPVKGGMLYALPHTKVCVAVTFQKRDYAEAPYAEFASEMLGLDSLDVSAPYSIENISITGVNEADPNLYYFVYPRHLSVNVDSRHLLRSVGISQAEFSEFESYTERRGRLNSDKTGEMEPQNNLYDRADTFYVRGDKAGRPSLVTTKKDSRNIRQRAEAAAQRLEELQDKRQQLLYGEYEGGYTPESLKYLCDRLAEQEERLLAQFLGKTITETVRFYVDPKVDRASADSQSVVLFGFSPKEGLVVGDSLPAGLDTVRCTIHRENTLKNAARFVKSRTKGRRKDDTVGSRKTFKYRQAESAQVTVYGARFAFETEVKIAQFGPIVDLPKYKFEALFDAKTGDLIYYKN